MLVTAAAVCENVGEPVVSTARRHIGGTVASKVGALPFIRPVLQSGSLHLVLWDDMRRGLHRHELEFKKLRSLRKRLS